MLHKNVEPFKNTKMRTSLQQYIWLDSLCELQTGALHRQLGINNTVALGYSPEKHFYPNDSDNLLNQTSHFISLIICLHGWKQLWPTFLHIVAVSKNLLTIIHTVRRDNESFLWCNKIAPFLGAFFLQKKWFSCSWLVETLNLPVTMNAWAVDMPQLSKTSCPQRDLWPAMSEQEEGKWNLGNREGCWFRWRTGEKAAKLETALWI